MTCEDEDVVAAAGPAPRRVRGDAVDDLPLAAVVGVPLLPAERALGGAPPELQLRGERREEGHEDDVGPGGVANPHGVARRGRALLGGEEVQREPILDAVLQVEAAGVLRDAVPDVRPQAAPGGGAPWLPVEQAEVELEGEIVHEDPQQRRGRIAFPGRGGGAGALAAGVERGRRGGGVEE